jgi:Retinoic acid induced 16-like protein
LEQLKLYELLVSHSRNQLLVHEPFLRPLLKLLASSQNEIFPHDVGKRLVILLNQLCVVLMQNVHLLDLFFCSTQQHGLQTNGGNQTNFIIFSLLIPYVHCDGSIGHQARDGEQKIFYISLYLYMHIYIFSASSLHVFVSEEFKHWTIYCKPFIDVSRSCNGPLWTLFVFAQFH